MNNNLDRVPFLIDLSRRTSRVIRQNLAIGLGFVVIGMVMGGVQALSRSLYARIIPANKSGEFFGFFGILG